MQGLRWTRLLATSAVAWTAGCSSNEPENDGEVPAANGSGLGGTAGDDLGAATGGAPPRLQTAIDETGGASPSVYAESTPDGLLGITAEEAAAFTSSKSNCAGWSAEPEGNGPPVLEFVIDVTGSMADLPAYPDDPSHEASRWDEMQRVLPGVFADLPADWVVGLSYYRKPDDGCFEPDQSVPIGILDAAQKAAVTASIQRRRPQADTNAPDNVQGATPTLAAWRAGLAELVAWVPPPGYEPSPRYVVVITDGVPTVESDGCTYTNPITRAEYDREIEIVREEGEAAGVRTFVVGVLGSEQTQNATYDPLYMLSQLALAGRTEQPPGCVPTSGTVDGSVEPSVLTARGS